MPVAQTGNRKARIDRITIRLSSEYVKVHLLKVLLVRLHENIVLLLAGFPIAQAHHVQHSMETVIDGSPCIPTHHPEVEQDDQSKDHGNTTARYTSHAEQARTEAGEAGRQKNDDDIFSRPCQEQ